MSISSSHLRKILYVFQLTDKALLPVLKKDIQNEGKSSGGRDFYMPFWSDAKLHAIGDADLKVQTDLRVQENRRRRNLYPRLRDGFLLWWNEKRRWNNQNCQLIKDRSLSGRHSNAKLDIEVRVQNLMSLKVGEDSTRLIYPYFQKLALSSENARIGLWLLSQTLTKHQLSDIRILDVIRGKSFSIQSNPLQGDEESLYTKKYAQVLRRRQYLIDNP